MKTRYDFWAPGTLPVVEGRIIELTGMPDCDFNPGPEDPEEYIKWAAAQGPERRAQILSLIDCCDESDRSYMRKLIGEQ